MPKVKINKLWKNEWVMISYCNGILHCSEQEWITAYKLEQMS